MPIKNDNAATSAIQSRQSDPLSLLKKAFPKRLKQAIGSRSIHAFAKACGMSDSLVRKYLAGSLPGLDKAVIMAAESGVSLEWLTGAGLDSARSATATSFDMDLMEAVIATTRQNFQERDIKLPPEEEAKVIRLIYELKTQSQESARMRQSIKIDGSEFPISNDVIDAGLGKEP